MKFYILLVFVIVVDMVTSAKETNETLYDGKRQERFTGFSLFSLIRFPNSQCAARDGLRNGTCYTQKECLSKGGIDAGTCASNYGTCCVFDLACNKTVEENYAYFVSPGYPMSYDESATCSVKIEKPSSIDKDKVCQILLEFVEFDVVGPTNGSCLSDMFIVSGADSNVRIPVICGNNSGQHMYISVESAKGPVTLTMKTGTQSYQRRWRIKITQLECKAKDLAPQGCLQYFTDSRGVLKSFNADQQDESMEGYMNNQDYAICIRRKEGMCAVAFYVPKLPGYYFSLNSSEIADYTTGFGSTLCSDDYISFPGLDRLCGTLFTSEAEPAANSPILVSQSGPIVIYFRSGASSVGRGFAMAYAQGSCHPTV